MKALTNRHRQRIAALLRNRDVWAMDGEHWVTLHPNGKGSKGTPALIDESGKIIAGAGGKLDGKIIHPKSKSANRINEQTTSFLSDKFKQKPVSQIEGEESMELYHGSSKGRIEKIHEGGAFGGIFASHSKTAAESHIVKSKGQLHQINIPESRVAETRNLNDLYGADLVLAKQAIRKIVPTATRTGLDSILEAATNDRSLFDMTDDEAAPILKALHASDVGEADHEIQQVRGAIASALGYQAVAMKDEHGTSYLVLPGNDIKPAATQSELPAAQSSAPTPASATQQAAQPQAQQKPVDPKATTGIRKEDLSRAIGENEVHARTEIRTANNGKDYVEVEPGNIPVGAKAVLFAPEYEGRSGPATGTYKKLDTGMVVTGVGQTYDTPNGPRARAYLAKPGEESKPAPGPLTGTLSKPVPIMRETDKAYGVSNPAYEEAQALHEYGGDMEVMRRGSPAARTAWREKKSLIWVPKSQATASGGEITGMSEWFAHREGFSTNEATQRRERAFEDGKARYAALIQEAKAAGVKGVREGMKATTIRQKLGTQTAGNKAVDLLKAGQESGLPQYQGVNEGATRQFAAMVHAYPHNVSQGNWRDFDARGMDPNAIAEMVKGGLLKEGDSRYRHELTQFGKEVAKQTVINKMQTKQTDSMDAANLSERIATLYKKVMQR